MVTEEEQKKKGQPAPRTPKRRVSDVVPSGEAWPNIPRRELSDLLDQDIVIEDVVYRKGRFGEFAIILARFPDKDSQFTTACGGEVVVRKLHDLQRERNIPILGAISYENNYYDLM